jgi:pyruvate/2-oxoglutarate dehydrogenase complex dihydrolipoamide dehydrogenase (E3) component
MGATRTFDALVIGTGQAGPALAVRLGAAGRTVCIVERGHFGGTCVNYGCTPTKTMIASAHAAHAARTAGAYGVEVAGSVSVDMRRVKARKDEVVGKSRAGLEKWLRGSANVTVVQGEARFTGPRAVAVGDEAISAAMIFINVGARSARPAFPVEGGVPYLTAETMMDVDFVPGHLLVVGGSYIGLEFGQMFRRFGSRVTVVEMAPRLIAREDPDVSDAVRGILEGEGVEVRVDAKCIALKRVGDRVVASAECDEGAPEVEASHVLVATGRTPNTDGLGLEHAGIAVDKRGYIPVGEDLQTEAAGIYALGDVNGRGGFTHTSYNDYEIVADNLLEGARRKVSDRVPIYALFTDPPLGRIGMTVEQARASGAQVLVGKRPMTRVSRAVEKGDTRGFMKAIVDARSRRILGAAVLGVGGDEAVQTLVDAMMAGLTAEQVIHGVRIHPTVAELVPTILGELEPLDRAAG